jgi:hypothetical protein
LMLSRLPMFLESAAVDLGRPPFREDLTTFMVMQSCKVSYDGRRLAAMD